MMLPFHIRHLPSAIGAILFAIAGLSSPAHSQNAARVTVDAGELAGDIEKGVRVFRGIPYAAPPIGEMRWRAPRPPMPWARTRDAYDFGPACPQKPSRDVSASAMSEDCLTLNVWAPMRRGGAALPVMVWIHGGGFNTGASRMPIYDGANLAERGVIVVTFNYRLGVLGFFGHPDLTNEAKARGEPTANYGLLDQVAALQWVQRNIQAFDGDPANVTVFGESAGGVSILALMTAPAVGGLFQKAIVQSGGGRWIAPSLTARSGPFLSAYDYGAGAARAFGLASEDAVADLRSKSWETLQDTLTGLPGFSDQTPFLDGDLLTEQIEPVFARGAQAAVPLIVGANSYEGVLLRGAFKVPADHVFRAMGTRVDELADLYRPQLIMTRDTLADHIWGDANFVEPARMIARDAARARLSVYHYAFDFQPPLLRLLGGSPHGLEVAYSFGNIRKVVPLPIALLMHPHNFEVSRLMTAYWTNFAKTGNPNGGGLLEWPRYAGDDEETLVFGNDGQFIERDYLKERLDLFKGVVW